MKKELFIKSINQIKKGREFDDKFCKVLEEMSSETPCYITLYNDTENYIYEILEDYYSEEIVDDYIMYFTCELDFGKEWYEGCITDDEGKNIKLKTINDLYNICEKLKNK